MGSISTHATTNLSCKKRKEEKGKHDNSNDIDILIVDWNNSSSNNRANNSSAY